MKAFLNVEDFKAGAGFYRVPIIEDFLGYVDQPPVDEIKFDAWNEWARSPYVWQMTSLTDGLAEARTKQTDDAVLQETLRDFSSRFGVQLAQVQQTFDTIQRNIQSAAADALAQGAQGAKGQGQSSSSGDSTGKTLRLNQSEIASLGRNIAGALPPAVVQMDDAQLVRLGQSIAAAMPQQGARLDAGDVAAIGRSITQALATQGPARLDPADIAHIGRIIVSGFPTQPGTARVDPGDLERLTQGFANALNRSYDGPPPPPGGAGGVVQLRREDVSALGQSLYDAVAPLLQKMRADPVTLFKGVRHTGNKYINRTTKFNTTHLHSTAGSAYHHHHVTNTYHQLPPPDTPVAEAMALDAGNNNGPPPPGAGAIAEEVAARIKLQWPRDAPEWVVQIAGDLAQARRNQEAAIIDLRETSVRNEMEHLSELRKQRQSNELMTQTIAQLGKSFEDRIADLTVALTKHAASPDPQLSELLRGMEGALAERTRIERAVAQQSQVQATDMKERMRLLHEAAKHNQDSQLHVAQAIVDRLGAMQSDTKTITQVILEAQQRQAEQLSQQLIQQQEAALVAIRSGAAPATVPTQAERLVGRSVEAQTASGAEAVGALTMPTFLTGDPGVQPNWTADARDYEAEAQTGGAASSTAGPVVVQPRSRGVSLDARAPAKAQRVRAASLDTVAYPDANTRALLPIARGTAPRDRMGPFARMERGRYLSRQETLKETIRDVAASLKAVDVVRNAQLRNQAIPSQLQPVTVPQPVAPDNAAAGLDRRSRSPVLPRAPSPPSRAPSKARAPSVAMPDGQTPQAEAGDAMKPAIQPTIIRTAGMSRKQVRTAIQKGLLAADTPLPAAQPRRARGTRTSTKSSASYGGGATAPFVPVVR